ncbi:MAG: hypothetical protein ABH952_05730, partial [Candidatus Omnitrophota bacterium]
GIIMVMIMTITLVAMAVGLGAVFPNFRQENPAQIVSGFGGTLLLIISLLYVGLSIVSVAIPFHRYFPHQEYIPPLFYTEIIAAISLVCVFSVLLIFAFMTAGVRALERMEF